MTPRGGCNGTAGPWPGRPADDDIILRRRKTSGASQKACSENPIHLQVTIQGRSRGRAGGLWGNAPSTSNRGRFKSCAKISVFEKKTAYFISTADSPKNRLPSPLLSSRLLDLPFAYLRNSLNISPPQPHMPFNVTQACRLAHNKTRDGDENVQIRGTTMACQRLRCEKSSPHQSHCSGYANERETV